MNIFFLNYKKINYLSKKINCVLFFLILINLFYLIKYWLKIKVGIKMGDLEKKDPNYFKFRIRSEIMIKKVILKIFY